MNKLLEFFKKERRFIVFMPLFVVSFIYTIPSLSWLCLYFFFIDIAKTVWESVEIENIIFIKDFDPKRIYSNNRPEVVKVSKKNR